MANYEGRSRTNYFKVKDAEAFKTWAEGLGLRVIHKPKEDLYSLLCNDDNTDFPYEIEVEDSDHTEEYNFEGYLAKHLAEGSVCVILHVGYEKMRYFSGSAYAFDHTGKSVSINLDDIYQKARETFGVAVVEEAVY